MLFEVLESRQLLSASVVQQGTVLYVRGGESFTQVFILETTDGVTVFSQDANGSDEVIKTGVQRIVVKLGNRGSELFAGTETIPVSVTSGSGDDMLSVNVGNNVNVSIDAGGGLNEIALTGGDPQGGTAVITTGSGDDIILATNFSNVVIASGSGEDLITVAGGNVVFVNAGSGDDRIIVNASGSTIILGGSGDDRVTLQGSGTFFVNGGAGADTLITTASGPVIPISIAPPLMS